MPLKDYTLASLLKLKWVTLLVATLTSFTAHTHEHSSGIAGVITGSVVNFVDYYQESIHDIREQGGTYPVYSPQWKYEPGLGLAGVLPEFDFLGVDIFSESYYLLDVPTIPRDRDSQSNASAPLPEIPAINRKVVGITETEGFTNPHIPPFRWTADARIGVESQVGGSPENRAPVRLYLMAPEKLDTRFVNSQPGPQVLNLDEVAIPVEELTQGMPGSIAHTNICDPYIRDKNSKANPYSCGVDGKDDCYDVTLISSLFRFGLNLQENPILEEKNRLLGTPLKIRVSNPKTAEAKIAEVIYGETKVSPKRAGMLFETLTPADGRLFVARRAFLPLVWQNQDSGRTQLGSYDVVYSIAPPEAEPCDVSQWGDLYPITHAPYDDRVNTRYGFAMQPFRDPTGAIIPDGVDLKGTYPWMDKEAKNFSVQVSPAKLFPSYDYDQNPQSRYPLRCVSESECSIEELRDTDSSKDNMFVVMGAWTQGKMVLLDGLLNDLDFRLRGADRNHSLLSIYQPNSGLESENSGEVRVGSTREGGVIYPVFAASGEEIGRYRPGNMSMFDSIENRLNYLSQLQHSRFQDVVWNMSSGHSTVEFAFDDYLNPDGFIVSNMVAALKHKNGHWYRMNYYDGWHQASRSFVGQVRVQNSATAVSDRWKIPAYGRVYNGRMEPVANGGVRGKGIWFDGEGTRIEYKIAEQPQSVHNKDWFYSLFVDPRFADDDQHRALIQFPDQSLLAIEGRRSIKLYNNSSELVATIQLPETFDDKAWSHLALLVPGEESGFDDGNIQVFVDGFLLYELKAPDVKAPDVKAKIERDNFRPVPGVLQLGMANNKESIMAFRGWMDEFKVFAYEPNPESICNFAHGSLIGLPADYQGEWRDQANLYSSESHAYVTHQLESYGEPTFSQYACYHDFTGDNRAHLFNLPEGTVALRESLNFPEGPLYFDAPRPDSSSNDFCLSCHHDNVIAGLGAEALEINVAIPASADTRRQPTQPPAKLYGNVPANWFVGSPDYAFDSGANGINLDEWVMPSAQGVGPVIKNMVLAESNGHPWRAVGQEQTLDYSQLPADITHLKANVNSLVREVVFILNGIEYSAGHTPFLLSTAALVDGVNEIQILAQDADNNEATYSLILNVLR